MNRALVPFMDLLLGFAGVMFLLISSASPGRGPNRAEARMSWAVLKVLLPRSSGGSQAGSGLLLSHEPEVTASVESLFRHRIDAAAPPQTVQAIWITGPSDAEVHLEVPLGAQLMLAGDRRPSMVPQRLDIRDVAKPAATGLSLTIKTAQ